MTNPDDMAFPLDVPESVYDGNIRTGLSKREYFAVVAMQSLMNRQTGRTPREAIEVAVSCADCLIETLNKGLTE